VADRVLHIGIDGRELMGRPTGVGRYLLGLLHEWFHDNTFRHRVTIWLPGEAPPSLEAFAGWFASRIEPDARAGTWWEQGRLPPSITRAGVDVFFAPAYTAPLRLQCPTVVTIHDLSYFAHPEWFSWREGVRRRWLTRAAARRARRVTTVSEFSASEIVRWLGVPREQIDVAPHGPPEVDRHAAKPAREPLVLFVGSLFNRRYIPELLSGFAAARRTADARLVLAGDNRTAPSVDPIAIAKTLGIGDRVEWRSYVPDAELTTLYDTARVFVFLSAYEGFAMTPLEALAHGVPVILLDTAVGREVYRDGARFVSLDPDAIGHAIAELVNDDRAHASWLAKGRDVLRSYSWARAAATVRESLERAARTP